MVQPVLDNGQLKQIDYVYSFRPIIHLSRIFGLMPFSITYNFDDKTHEIRVEIFDCIWFVISICLYISLAIFQYDNIILPKNTNSSYLMILGDYVILIMGLIVGAMTIGADMYNRYKILNILEMFNTFDKEV